LLYIFQAVPPPIIRSSKMYIQHLVFCKPFAIAEELELQFQLLGDAVYTILSS
jgi:hypothetical protein